MDIKIKKLADSGDIKSLKYLFVDSLDVDPTFVRYEDDYNYCKSIPGLLEEYIELTPLSNNEKDWDESYWAKLKMDLIKNFSDKRMSHMRMVAKTFLAEKVERILAERSKMVGEKKTEILNTNYAPTSSKPTKIYPSKEEQERALEEERRKLEREQLEFEAKQEAERKRREEQKRRMLEQNSQKSKSGNVSKKAIGIATAAVAVTLTAVAIYMLLK